MTSSLKQTNVYFEELFADNWTGTPIHFAGQEFDSADKDKWINPFYSPLRGSLGGLSTTATDNYGHLHIGCWAETNLDVMELSDEVIALVTSNVSTEYRVRDYEISDHGWSENNKSYTVVTFTIEVLNGTC